MKKKTPERTLWRLRGTYGRAECRLGEFHQIKIPRLEWDENGTTTLWFTSDVVARSTRLGPGGSLDNLYKAFERAGVPLEPIKAENDSDETCFSAGIRHRRIDSWSAADRRPRATRTAIQAGSVLRVRSADAGSSPEETMRRLARLSVTGIGELTAQGFGRFVVDHPLLREKKFRLTSKALSNNPPDKGNFVPAGKKVQKKKIGKKKRFHKKRKPASISNFSITALGP